MNIYFNFQCFNGFVFFVGGLEKMITSFVFWKTLNFLNGPLWVLLVTLVWLIFCCTKAYYDNEQQISIHCTVSHVSSVGWLVWATGVGILETLDSGLVKFLVDNSGWCTTPLFYGWNKSHCTTHIALLYSVNSSVKLQIICFTQMLQLVMSDSAVMSFRKNSIMSAIWTFILCSPDHIYTKVDLLIAWSAYNTWQS